MLLTLTTPQISAVISPGRPRWLDPVATERSTLANLAQKLVLVLWARTNQDNRCARRDLSPHLISIMRQGGLDVALQMVLTAAVLGRGLRSRHRGRAPTHSLIVRAPDRYGMPPWYRGGSACGTRSPIQLRDSKAGPARFVIAGRLAGAREPRRNS